MAIHFSLPDFTRNYQLNLLFMKLMADYPEYFREGFEISAVYGEYPSSRWNGGQLRTGRFPPTEMRSIAQTMNDKGISLRFSFDNLLIDETCLDDPHCNRSLMVTERFDEKNCVIVASPLLETFIRQKFPHFQMMLSEKLLLTDPDRLAAALEDDYDYVALDDSLNNNMKLLRQLPHKEKVELLVNPAIPPDYPRRKAYYQYLSRTQASYSDFQRKHGSNTPWTNPELSEHEFPRNTVFRSAELPTHLTPEDVFGRYADMGFVNFRIGGDTFGVINTAETYLYYLAKPEKRDLLRLTLLLSLEASGAITLCD